MKDFRVIRARVLLPVHSISPVRDFFPPSIIVRGDNLNRTSEIVFNGVSVDEYAILENNRIIAKIPESQIGRELTELKVFSNAFTTKSNTTLEFSVPSPTKTLEGMERLIQSWLLIFFTTPGSSVFNKTSGGGAYSIIGRTTDGKGKGITADLALAIEKTKNELTELQANKQYIPLSEKLLSTEIDSIRFDESTGTLMATITITNMLGTTASVSLGS